jgi:hypothetical protein
LEVTKTVLVPVHHAVTKRKLSILDRITARHTCCVWFWSKLLNEQNLKGTYTDRAR